jgi:hypothetical protein
MFRNLNNKTTTVHRSPRRQIDGGSMALIGLGRDATGHRDRKMMA